MGDTATATIEQPSAQVQAAEAKAKQEEMADLAAAAVVEARRDGPLTREKVDAARTRLTAERETKASEAKTEKPEQTKAAPKEEPKVEKKPGPKSGEKAAKEARQNETLAKHALRRDGWTDEEIDGLAPAALIQVGLKTKARLDADPERNGTSGGYKSAQTNTHGAPAQREGEGRTTDRSGPRQQERQTALGPEEDGPSSEELERVFESLDEQGREALRSHITHDLSKADRFVRAARKAEEEARKASQKAFDEMYKMRQSMTRNTLGREFPQIADDKRFESVEEFMGRLCPRDQWSRLDTDEYHRLMSDAAAAEFGREAIQAARAKHANELSDDMAGQPHVGGTKASDRASKTSSEDLAVRAVLESGRNNADARARFTRLKGV